jgi:PAS domain S-box-containing protein
MGYKESNKVAILFTDITARIKADQAIKESESNLRNMILHAPVAMCILDGPSLTLTIVNDRMFEIWGKSAEEMIGKPIFDALPEMKEQDLGNLIKKVYKYGKSFSASERPFTINRSGKPQLTFLNFVYEPFRSGNGNITGIMAVAIDVTEQVLARKKIEES